ncbi:MAG: hypothetical protein GY832_19535, partial [Chloroflexi bacterium]|nr:hypothetical protein [Chloroflexota bacterium]
PVSDVDTNDTYTTTLTAQPALGAASVTISGTWTYTPTIYPTDYVAVFTLTVTDSGGNSDTASVTVNVTALNNPPVADAGTDQTVVQDELVQLDGSASSDPDGHSLVYGWAQSGGSPALGLSAGDAISPTFAATDPGVFTFTLTVTDTFGLSSSDDVVITVTANNPPVADAGADQTVVQDELVQLDGSASSDPDGHSLIYGWVQSGGSPTLGLSAGDAISPTFAATDLGVFIFALTVTDTFGLSSSDDVVITVTLVPSPIYTLTVAISPTIGGTVSLDPPGGVYIENTLVELTANSATGYQFSAWSDDLISTTNPISITMTRDTTVTATFVSSGFDVYLPIVLRNY